MLEYFLFFCDYEKSLWLRKEGKDMYLLGSVTVTSEWFGSFERKSCYNNFFESETHEE